MKKRIAILICILSILFAGISLPAGGFADGDHPITLTITCDPDPELEEGGTIPDLLFTIHNTGTSDYTLKNATLSGGYEDRELSLDERITVLAGGTKEFHLADVPITDAQLDTDVVYQLSWTETEIREDTETGEYSTVEHKRDTSAAVNIPRFVLPELTVTVRSDAERARVGESFTVVYTIENNTKYDMSGLKLYDPEQSMQRIELPSAELYSGEKRSVEITCTMGKKDMTFRPVIEYTVRQREMVSQTQQPLKIESIVVDLTIGVQQYPTTREGASFAITVTNAGNRTVTDIRLFDEINTSIGDAFDLAPEQSKVLEFSVPSAVASGVIRKVRFHLRAVDCFGTTFTVTDPNQYDAIPYVDTDAVKLYLYVEMEKAFYDDNGKLCGTIQFEIRNYSDVTLHNAVLREENLFGKIVEYGELQNGETYDSETYQLDGVQSLEFYVKAYDPAGNEYKTGEVRLDLTNLKALADQSDEPVYVYPYNPFFKNLIQDLKKPVMLTLIVVLSVVAACMIACIALFIAERKLKAKLPPAFEDDMEKAMRKTQRRMDNPLFKDAPTEQFGYTVPIKLRDYGELTEQEAEARRQQYAKKLRENLDRDAKAASAKPTGNPTPEPENRQEEPKFAQTRIIPVSRIKPKEETPQKNAKAVQEDSKRTGIPPAPTAAKTYTPKPEPFKEEAKPPYETQPIPIKPRTEKPTAERNPKQEPIKQPKQEKTIKPEQTVEPEPIETIVPEPEQAVEPEPIETIVPEPERTVEPEPVEATIPEPERTVGPESVETIVPEPEQAEEPALQEPVESQSEMTAEPEQKATPESEETPEPEKTVPTPAAAFSEIPLIKPQLPSFIAKYIEAQTEREEQNELQTSTEEPTTEAATEPEPPEEPEHTEAPLSEPVVIPVPKESFGPRCFDAMQRPQRRKLVKQTVRHMNG